MVGECFIFTPSTSSSSVIAFVVSWEGGTSTQIPWKEFKRRYLLKVFVSFYHSFNYETARVHRIISLTTLDNVDDQITQFEPDGQHGSKKGLVKEG